MAIRRVPLRRVPLRSLLCRVPLRPPLPLRLSGLLSAVACTAVVLSGCGSQPFGPQPGGPQPGGQQPGAERVPPTAAVLTVTPVFGLNRDPRAERLDRAFTVTDPAQVARIAAVVNGLARSPAGAFSCPADSGAQMRLTFSVGPGGPVVARLTAEYGGCGIVSVRIGGRDMPGLSEAPRSGPPLQQQVLAIAGVSWPVEPGSAS